MIYKTTEEYAPDHEHGIRWDDPGAGHHLADRQPDALGARQALAAALQSVSQVAAWRGHKREIPCRLSERGRRRGNVRSPADGRILLEYPEPQLFLSGGKTCVHWSVLWRSVSQHWQS